MEFLLILNEKLPDVLSKVDDFLINSNYQINNESNQTEPSKKNEIDDIFSNIDKLDSDPTNYLTSLDALKENPFSGYIRLFPYGLGVVLSEVKFVISDSGGIQEECAAFRKKILVCRNNTERPEGIEAGFAKIIGTELIKNFGWANDNPKWSGKNPYGVGNASENILATLGINI